MCASVWSWGCVPMVGGRVCVSVSVCWGRRGLCLYLCVYVCVREMCVCAGLCVCVSDDVCLITRVFLNYVESSY